jgi:hypothetical protein
MMPLVINVKQKPELTHAAHSLHRRLRAVLVSGDSADPTGSPALGDTGQPTWPIHRPRRPASILLPLRGYAVSLRRRIRRFKTLARWSWSIAWQLTRFSFDLLRFLEYITSERGDCN